MLTTICLLLTFLPGVYGWWSGISLVTHLDDPLLPEKLLIRTKQLTQWVIVAFALLVVLPTSGSLFGQPNSHLSPLPLIALMLLNLLAGCFPSRKRLFGETWDFLGYLEFRIRIFLAFSGFVFVLILTPYFIAQAGNYQWLAIATLALLLYGRLFLNLKGFAVLLGAKPVNDLSLIARFDAIAARSKVAPPVYLVCAFPGGRVANAFAVPALPRPGVVFFQTLLDELQPDETDAIFAHEMGHLEHMNEAFVKKYSAGMAALITLALSAGPLAEFIFPDSEGHAVFFILLGIVLGVTAAKLAGHQRHHERESDERAVELCGNAEALQRGLARLHELGRLPRRWNNATEQASTHPSLVNRIRAINAAAGVEEKSLLAKPIIVPSTTSDNAVIFKNDRIHWLEGISQLESLDPDTLIAQATTVTIIAYSELRELLLHPNKRHGAVLSATDRKGRSWKMDISNDCIPLAQTALANSDLLISPQIEKPSLLKLIGAVFAMTLALLAFKLGKLVLLGNLAILCVFVIRAETLAALGLFAAGEGLSLFFRSSPSSFIELFQLALLIGLGIAASVYAYRRAPTGEGLQRAKYLWLIGLLSLLSAIGLSQIATALAKQPDSFLLYHLARVWPESSAGLFGIAGAILVAEKSLRSYWKPVASGLAATLMLFFQTPFFGERIGQDPFAVSAQQPQVRNRVLAPVKQIVIDQNPYGLRLSPSGNWIAYRAPQKTRDGYQNTMAYTVTDLGRNHQSLTAGEMVFVDDKTLLALSSPSTFSELQLYQRQNQTWKPQQQWRLSVTYNNVIRFDPESRAWSVVGISPEDEYFVTTSGRIDASSIESHTFKHAASYSAGTSAILLNGKLFSTQAGVLSSNWLYWPPAAYLSLYQELWEADSQAAHKIASTSSRELTCSASEPRNAKSIITCLSQSNNGNRLGWINTETGKAELLLKLPDDIQAYGNLTKNGTFFFFKSANNKLMAVNRETKELVEIDLPSVKGWISDIGLSDSRLATTAYDASLHKTTLYIFDIEKL